MGLNNTGLGKTLASLGAAVAIGFAPEAEARERHDHAVFNVEASNHKVTANGGYFHEIADHFSLGLAVGGGTNFQGHPVGAAEGLVAYHKTLSRRVAQGVFGVLEGGGGVEAVVDPRGAHFELVARSTVIVGLQVNKALSVFTGVNHTWTSDSAHMPTSDLNNWSVSVGTVFEL